MSKKKKKNNNSKIVSTENVSSKENVTKNNSKTKPIKVIDDIDNSFKEEIKKNDKDIKNKKVIKNTVVNGCLVIVLLTSLVYFIVSLFYSTDGSLANLISSLLLMVFTIIFVSISFNTNRRNKLGILFGSFILFIYFIFGILFNLGKIDLGFVSTNLNGLTSGKVIDFTRMSLTDVIKWSEKNSINIIQDYEYSDMIEEYHIISQSVEEGTSLKGIKDITVSISEGPNPSKEVVIPNMVSWDSERVLAFIKDNHLSNVIVEFVESSKEVNTVIEQSKSGSIKRNDELKLVFSYGEELGYEEVKLIDFTNMSKFEVTFYLKQHHLNYEFDEDFSSDIKQGFAVRQSVDAGTMVKVNDQKVIVTISKGPEIKVPNLMNLSMSEVTEWVIKNKLKLEFSDSYDDTISENSVISANYKEGDIISQGSVIKVVISRGKLTMPKFNSFGDFRDWAEKYGIRYEEKHEFNDEVSAGEAISYSYKTGEVIKNNDAVVVVLSDGKAASVPNVVGSTKSDATNKLKNAGFGYNFVYSYSDSVTEGKAIKQSISAGSKVAEGTTVTVTISKGKKPANSSSNSGGSSSSNNSGGSTAPSKPSTPACTPVTYTIGRNLNNIFNSYSGYSDVSSALYSFFSSNYPGVKISVVGVADTGMSSGSYVGGIGPGSSITSCNSSAYVIQIAK